MSDLSEHQRHERLLHDRPEVARRRDELVRKRAELLGELRGLARGIRLGRAGLRLINWFRRISR